MTCPECGAAVHPADRFCSLCGTTLPRDHTMPTTPPADDATTTELPVTGARPTPAAPAGAPVPAAATVPSAPTAAPVAEPDDAFLLGGRASDEPPADRRTGCLGMVALALVGLLMLAGMLWFFGSDGDEDSSVAAPSVSSSASASDEAPSPEETASDAPSDGPTPTQRASTAKECGTVDGATAWSGNEVTSCDFATETAQALMASSADLPATVTARSPVTGRDYEMRCENTTPVVCRGGTDALVYVDVPN
ncbi:hypothetical protein PDTK01_27410 [Phycicoccus sp. DTK01]|nr:hypothetical protein PDTK01_27410 [Phycicoccus sp. DTK01]